MSSKRTTMPSLRTREDTNPPRLPKPTVEDTKPSIRSTNVVELFSRIIKIGGDVEQLVFYNSGIGTYARPSFRSFSYWKQVIYNHIDTAIAWNFEKIIHAAYKWLSENYEPGDRIFLFGFSRGAYQVRRWDYSIKAMKTRFRSLMSYTIATQYFVPYHYSVLCL
ncbi:hypothetical protein ONZ45_g15703 [Pleurotus djamor]|nr:hypothetical protein ONZ45_g15703 [Pleurotus djamor]